MRDPKTLDKMPDTKVNLRFQVLVNGEARGTAGMDQFGVMNAILNWVRRDPTTIPKEARTDPRFNEADWTRSYVNLQLGGLDSTADEFVSWFREELKAGDEVTLRVLPPSDFDPPADRRCVTEGG